MAGRAASRCAVIILVAALWGGSSSRASADPGDIDPTFGDDGFATIDGLSELRPFERALSVVAAPDGGSWVTFLVSGADPDRPEGRILRLDENGDPVATFDGDGLRSVDLGSGTGVRALGSPYPVGDGGVQVSGLMTTNGDDGAFVRRYTSTGTPDTSFGRHGAIRTHQSASDERSAIGTDGSIVQCTIGDGVRVRVRAWDDSGGRLSSLGGDGQVVIRTHLGFVAVRDCAATAAGGVLLVMQDYDTSDTEVIRLTSGGTPDDTYGADGRVVVAPVADPGYCDHAWITPDGAVVVGCTRFVEPRETQARMTLIRLTEAGELDETFGVDGTVSPRGLGRFASYGDASFSVDGDTYIAGETYRSGSPRFVLRLNPTGHLESGYGTDGIASIIGATAPYPESLELDSGGRALVALAPDTNPNGQLARLRAS